MTNKKYNYSIFALLTALALIMSVSCTRDIDVLEPATYPKNAEVFIDGFSAGLVYEAWGDVFAFDVDKVVKYKGSASMKFAVPDFNSPNGSFIGGAFKNTGRDLSGFDALTFWAKASKAATLNEVGFGENSQGSNYKVSATNLKMNTNWKKYIIPIPDPSKLTIEGGMLYYSEAPEEGSGYTFWIDEVKFEKLGTIAHPKPAILNGNDKVGVGFSGTTSMIDGLSYIFNLPSGINDTIYIAPGYFEFNSSNENIATVDESGTVSILSTGTTVITASVGDTDAAGSLTIESTGSFEHAPVPTVDPDSVISLFSNTYTNVAVDYYNGYWAPYQTTQSADFEVEEDNVLNYTNFNFVGIQFTSPTIDATSMTHLHLDLFIPNEVDPNNKIGVKVVDLGSDGAFGDPDPSVSVTYTSPDPLVSQKWIGLDIDISSLASRDKLAQIVFETPEGATPLSNFYVDNVYFYDDGSDVGGGGGNEPADAAPSPTHTADDVISIFSDAYTNLEGTDYPDWGQATVVSNIVIAEDNILKFAGLNFQGIQLGSSQDISEKGYLHIDYWTENSTALNVYLISTGPVETGYALAVPTSGWVSLDIPLSDFSPVDLADIIQLKFDGEGDIFMDNIYFLGESGGDGGGSEPTEGAPTPTQNESDVISLFSDSFTNVTVDTWRTEWSSATLEDVTIAGSAVKKYSDLDFVGILTEASTVDASGMTHMHIDVWSADFTLFGIKLVDFGPNGVYDGGGDDAEHQVDINSPNQGEWVSLDIPLSDFTNLTTKANLAQYVLVGQPTGATTVYVDNLYFYDDDPGGGSGDTEPSEAAPTPTHDASDVISIFSDAYSPIDNLDLNPGWGQATVYSEVSVAGNNTMLYTGLDYQGIDFDGNHQDVSGMEFLHIDFWSANSTSLNVYLISPGNETPFALTVPTTGWSSVDIPLASFSSVVDLTDVFQFKFDGNGDIYLDNIYFHGESGGNGGGTEPTEAAPIPTQNESDVISLFSDGYSDVTVDTWLTEWSSATLEDVTIAGSAVKKYSDLDFVGILTEASTVDASGMTHVHLDVWSADITLFGIKLVDFGANGVYDGGGDDVEHQVDINSPNQGEWVSLDIPLSDFTNLTTKANLAQYILVGQPTGATTVYLDNFYFYDDGSGGGGGSTGPTTAALTPTKDAADVISFFSNAYTDKTVDAWSAEWDDSDVTDLQVAGDDVKKYTFTNFAGIDFSNHKLDLSGMTHFHMDIWTPDEVINKSLTIKCVDFGGGTAEVSNFILTIVHTANGDIPALEKGSWVSIDVPISAFTGDQTRTDLAQMVLTCNLSNVYVDNIYFFK